MAAHVPNQPTGVAMLSGATRAYLSTLNILDRTFTQQLVEKYGNDSYVFVMEMLGKKVKTENNSFYHYEKRRNMRSAQVASHTGGASAGVDCVCTISAGSHYDSGTKSPGRVGEVVMISANGVLGKISVVDVTTPSAHIYTVKPLKSTDTFAPANNDWLLFQGAQHVGEASSKLTSIQPVVDRVTNTITEIRDDYRITDKAAMERIEFEYEGNRYFKYFGSGEAEKNWLNCRELLVMFSDVVNNAGITTNGTVGAKGALTQIQAGGSDLAYTAGSMTIADWQGVTRQLTFNGVAAEIQGLLDVYQYQEVQKLLFTTYNGGAVVWASVGGSQDAAVRYGFQSFAIDGFSFHFKKYAPFSPEWEWGVTPAATPNYRNYGVYIPQGFSNVMGQSKLPTISIRYQEAIPGKEIDSYPTGGYSETNKTDVRELLITTIGHYGVQVAAANQCVILNG